MTGNIVYENREKTIQAILLLQLRTSFISLSSNRNSREINPSYKRQKSMSCYKPTCHVLAHKKSLLARHKTAPLSGSLSTIVHPKAYLETSLESITKSAHPTRRRAVFCFLWPRWAPGHDQATWHLRSAVHAGQQARRPGRLATAQVRKTGLTYSVGAAAIV